MSDINYINLYNSFTAQAKSAIQEEVKQTQQLTFKTVASITALCVAVVLKDSPDKKNSVVKTGSITVSEFKLRNVILESLYPNIKERKQLNTSAGRPIYNKIRAALILFHKDQKKLFKLWFSCYNNKIESSSLEDFTSGVLAIVESYKSLTKILEIAKKRQNSKANIDNESDSANQSQTQQASESVSNKSLYNKLSTDLTHVINLIEKAESLDGETLQMVLAGVAKISEVIKAKTQDKKATKKSTKKAA